MLTLTGYKKEQKGKSTPAVVDAVMGAGGGGWVVIRVVGSSPRPQPREEGRQLGLPGARGVNCGEKYEAGLIGPDRRP